jgi:hypothetical protein
MIKENNNNNNSVFVSSNSITSVCHLRGYKCPVIVYANRSFVKDGCNTRFSVSTKMRFSK